MPPEDKKKIFGLNRNAFFLGLVSLFNDFSNAMIQSIMPYFLSQVLGIPKTGIGLIEGIANAISSALRIFSGWLSDKIGKRKSLAVMGYALSVFTRPLFIFVSSSLGVGIIRAVDRVGKGFRDSPRDALLASSVDQKELGKSFGYQRMMDALGGFLGPLGAFIFLVFITEKMVVTGPALKNLFWVAFGIGILAVLSFFFVREVKADPGDRIYAKLGLHIFKGNKQFLLFIFSVFIFGLGAIPEVLMFTRSIDLEFSIVLIPVVYFIYNGTFAFLSGPLGRISDKIGERVVITGGFVFAFAACLLLAFTDSKGLAILAFILMGIYSAATDGIERALASKLVDRHLLATGEGILQAAIGTSSLISAVIGGLLWDNFGHAYAFAYWGIASAVGLLTFIFISMNGIKHDKDPHTLL